MEFNITLFIIIITCITSYLAINDISLKHKLMHYPYNEKRAREYHRFVSSGFVHADYIHLAFNMFVLYNFGGLVEQIFELKDIFGPMIGKLVFVLFYLLNIVAADLPTYFRHKDNQHFSSLGASGAVSGVLFIFILYAPFAPLRFFFIPINIPAIVVGIAYLAYSSYASQRGGGKINHTAHLYGALFGIAFFWITNPHMVTDFIQQITALF